jgi:hypothetical protein
MARLEAMGFDPEDSLTKAAAPVVLRGNNLVLAAPPAPGYALPVVAAALSRDEISSQLLVLAGPEAALTSWLRATAPLADAAGRRALLGLNPTRAAHHLAAGSPDFLLTTTGVLTELFRKSAVEPGRIGSLALVWPELEPSDEILVSLFAELPKETQRLVITANRAATESLVERYAWRAPLVGPLGGGAEPAAPIARRLRVAIVGWDRRVDALGELVDLLDQDRLVVWTADRTAHGAIRDLLAGRGAEVELVERAAPSAGFVVCFDPPPPELISQLGADAVLFAPAEAEPYLNHWIERPIPLALGSVTDAARRELAADREAIRNRIEHGLDRASLLTLGPLFERYTSTAVAVALHALWTSARKPGPPVVERPSSRLPPATPRSKVWLNAGRKDGITLGEILSLLTFDLGIGRDHLGRVDLRETFSLIEFDSDAAAQDAIDKLAGRTLKNRRLAARLDRGRDSGRQRGPRPT